MATPTPLGKYVTLSHYVDANFYHDLISGLSVNGTLHVLNQKPINWFLKNILQWKLQPMARSLL